MTVKDFIYKYYFPTFHTKETIFRLVPRGANIEKTYMTLYHSAFSQPTYLYKKIVCKFWIERADEEQAIIWILYE